MEYKYIYQLLLTVAILPLHAKVVEELENHIESDIQYVEKDLENLSDRDSRLERELQKYREQAREIIQRKNQKLITDITTTLQGLQDIEDKNDITPLIKEMGKLRYEACKLQQKPALKKYSEEQMNITKKINAKTETERKQIDQLTTSTKNLPKDDPKRKRLRKLEENLNKAIEPLIKKLKVVNKQIYADPEMKQLFEKAAPVQKEIYAKYANAKAEIEPLNKKLTSLIEKVNKNLDSSEQELRQIRENIKRTTDKLYSHNACFMAYYNMKQQTDWLDLFL